MIIKEAIGVGSTIEAAREDALNKLNAAFDEDVQYETLALAKKKVMGIFGGSEAKIRAYVEGPDMPAEKPKKQNKQAVKPQAEKKSAKKENKKASDTEVAEKKVKTVEAKGVPADKVDPESPAGKAYKYLSDILVKLGCEGISATIAEVEGGSKITLEGSDKLGVIIGRRGETLDALQYLASLVANEKGAGYYRIVIDIGNYREKRENTLEALARRTAAQVLRTERSRSLEPMNPYERRIIHTTVQDIEGVTSTSIGDGANRRVVISPEGKPLRNSGGRNNGRSSGRDNRGQGRPSGNSKSVAPAESAKPKETDGTKLYGRLG